MASIMICVFIINHVFLFADILLETAFLPFLVCLRFYIGNLLVLFQKFISLFTFVPGISRHAWIFKSEFLLHGFQKWNQRPDIIAVGKDIYSYNIFAVHSDLDIISRLQLGISHVIIFHMHKRSIYICF